jgi:hypothetical protein
MSVFCLMCRGPGSNRRPLPLQGNALPTELPRHLEFNFQQSLLIQVLVLRQTVQDLIYISPAVYFRQRGQIWLQGKVRNQRNNNNYSPVRQLPKHGRTLRADQLTHHRVVFARKSYDFFQHFSLLFIHRFFQNSTNSSKIKLCTQTLTCAPGQNWTDIYSLGRNRSIR